MATITEDYVSFEIAKLLKEKGFPQQRMEFAVATRDCSFIVNGSQKVKECAGTKFPYYPYSKLFLYEEDWAVLPTLQMAMKWLREVHGLFISIGNDDLDYNWQIFDVRNRTKDLDPTCLTESYAGYREYELAAEAAIKYCLENLI